MRQIYDFYRNPPRVGQRMALCPVENDWAWFALDESESAPEGADQISVYDGHHAAEIALFLAVRQFGGGREFTLDVPSGHVQWADGVEASAWIDDDGTLQCVPVEVA